MAFPNCRKVAIALALVLAPHAGMAADIQSFLKARMASLEFRFGEAADHFLDAAEAEGGDSSLLALAVPHLVASGRGDEAVRIARQLQDDNVSTEATRAVLLVDRFMSGDFASVAAGDPAIEVQFLPSINRISEGWAHFSLGDIARSVESFEAAIEAGELDSIARMHEGLMLAAGGDFEGAEKVFARISSYPDAITDELRVARALTLYQLDPSAAAGKELFPVANADSDAGREMLSNLYWQISDGGEIEYDYVVDAPGGLGEALATVARQLELLGQSIDEAFFAEAARLLEPESARRKIESARVLNKLGNHRLAIDALEGIAVDDPLYVLAEVERANALEGQERIEDAIELVEGLTESHPDRLDVHYKLGMFLASADQNEDSRDAFSVAAELNDSQQLGYWQPLFRKSTAQYELGDLQTAIDELDRVVEESQRNPWVLNYLGYVLADENLQLEYAEALIREAVEEQPWNGAFIDSLGWALYRQGHFDESLEQMEIAIKLEPTDPIVIDHLGDVYWMVGRQREAEFQWRRALAFDPSEREYERIHRKLEFGLDRVIADEMAGQ